MDHYVVIYGMLTVIKRLGLLQQFNVIQNLFDKNLLNRPFKTLILPNTGIDF